MKSLKKIQFYPLAYNIHNAHKVLIDNPLKGYEFLEPIKKINISKIKKIPFILNIHKFFVNFLKINITQKVLNKEKIPKDVDLIYSVSIYEGNLPWVLDILDNPYSMTGYNYGLFLKEKDSIEKKLLKDNCKAIICSNETSLSLMNKYFSKKVLDKTSLIRPAVKIHKLDSKEKNKNIFQILFMGSITNPEDFLIKGGLETLECFSRLSKKYSKINIVIKCKTTEEIKKKYSSEKIRFIEEKISDEDLSNLYQSSNILLMPGHTYFLMAFLEAMSYGLPIVCLDTYAVRDYVENNKSGIIIKKSNKLPYDDPSYPCNVRSKEFISLIKEIDERVILGLCQAIEKLVNNPNLVEKLGKESIKIVNTKFSIEKRNNNLKKVLDSCF